MLLLASGLHLLVRRHGGLDGRLLRSTSIAVSFLLAVDDYLHGPNPFGVVSASDDDALRGEARSSSAVIGVATIGRAPAGTPHALATRP